MTPFKLVLAVVILSLLVGALLGTKSIQEEEVHSIDPRGDVTWIPPTTSTPPTTFPMSHVTVKPRARTAPNVWDAIAECESGGNWSDTRGNYEGGLHFMHDTWVRAGGRRYAEHAYQATREQQIEIAKGWLARTSWEQWPVCSRKVGVR